ncbi:flagellar motor protein MotB [Sphingomonas sp. DG1-23]|jgi:flagellar motor protein MotB|uniref:flagellar motor protein MotB n=1 Tax=Sphingomonas sp. DG1-23 TaxID=3068316 RepID=UPI0027401201|nr:flagellar motor protein MotB [Sphingomonas sp. DG1-23]MDP5280396.1 flagellar motor protein MotB [Sphingomonas sp. DG1-23]
MIAEDDLPARPIWLTTLADLALLLVGFFVLLQANQVDANTLAAGFRAGFGVKENAPAMPVDLATVSGFATGSAQLPDASAALGWAHAAAADPRTRLRIIGEVDGSAADVDPLTGSGPILAADRARAVAAMLIRSGAVAPERIAIATARGHRRAVLSLGYDGGRQ